MKLVLLYGAPAVGKLTVANELSKLTGYKNFHNHLVINVVSEIFGYNHPVHRRMEHEIRRRIVEEAAAAKINLIVTGVIASVNKDLYKAMIDAYQNNGGEACLVHLKADLKILESRVSHPSRERKIHTTSELDKFMDEYPECVEKFGDGEQLEIDTSKNTPQQSAQKIATHFRLT